MANTASVNGSALNGSSRVLIAAAAALTALAVVSCSGVRVQPGAATPAASALVTGATFVQFHQGGAAGAAAGVVSTNSRVVRPGAASAVAGATFAGTVAPAGGNSAMGANAALTLSPVVVKFSQAEADAAGTASAVAVGRMYPVLSVTAPSTFYADPGGTFGGVTSFNATGRFGLSSTLGFTVDAIRVVVTDASFGAVSGVFAAASTYKHTSATSSFSAQATALAGGRHTMQVGATAAASSAASAAVGYKLKQTAAANASATLATWPLLRFTAAGTPTVTSALAAAPTTRVFSGYNTATAAASMTALAGMNFAGSTASLDGEAVCVFMAEASLRQPDAVEIQRPAEVRELARTADTRELTRIAT